MQVLINSGEPLLARTLARWGYEPLLAADGRDALEQLAARQPVALAILNYEMEGLRGDGLCRLLRSAASERYVYVILLMEKTQQDDLLEALEQGADDYLVKPYDAYELRCKLLVAKRILGLQERLLVQATHDALTGLWNRKAAMDALSRELARASRERRPVGLLLADLDHFKQINDTYGHLAGDCVLQTVAARLKSALRAYDTVGRYGGEEFLIISPGCDEEALLRRAENLRAVVANEPVAAPEASVAVSLSLGAAVAVGEVAQDQLLKSADEALYRAKRAGRNRVEMAR